MDANGKKILELVRRPGNSTCADCGSLEVTSASYNIGVFLCDQCAGVHVGLGAHISKTKHLKMGRWEDSQVRRMEEVGNTAARRKYEERVPACYRRPTEHDPQILREHWIRAKYLREEFIHAERQRYTQGVMEGYLMKRSKIDDSCRARKFVLSERDQTLKYYVSSKQPKAEIRILDMNVVFAHNKLPTPTSLQISYLHNGTTRHIYVYHEEAEVIVDWYMAIRSAKLNLLHVAHPNANQSELCQWLTHDFLKEGSLLKTGPKSGDAFKRRWFILDGRKLMYHEQCLDAHPKGEIFVGHQSDGYSVFVGAPAGWKMKEQGQPFTLKTPSRSFVLSADLMVERDQWIDVLRHVMQRPLTPQDAYLGGILVKKRSVPFFSIR